MRPGVVHLEHLKLLQEPAQRGDGAQPGARPGARVRAAGRCGQLRCLSMLSTYVDARKMPAKVDTLGSA